MRDWVGWHDAYDDPSSILSARLRLVQAQLARAIDRAPAGPVRLLSLCAGQGHDVLGVLPGHPRRDDVSVVLVEADPDNAEAASEHATRAGLAQVDVRLADASRVACFADMLPADVLILCGIFGNVSETDIERTIAAAPALAAPRATVIWTRHRRPPDLTPRIRALFAVAGFEEVAFGSPEAAPQIGVGAARFTGGAGAPPPGAPVPGASWPDEPLFTFRDAGTR